MHISIPFCKNNKYLEQFTEQGPVVESWVSANRGLKFNPLFKFPYFYPSILPKLSGSKLVLI